MLACYDLARCPPTYDVVAFLAHAEIERRARGASYLDIRILPGPAGGFRPDALWPHSIEERIAMRDNVLVPLCRLLPSVATTSLQRDRREVRGAFGVGQYLVGLPSILAALRQDCRPLRGRRVSELRGGGDKRITFTLREAAHHPLRNSRTDEWVAAARILGQRGWEVIVVRDAARWAESLADDIPVDPRAARDLLYRADLYASAALNVGVSNGPMWMSIFMDAPTLMLRPTTPEAGGCYDDHFFSRHGLRRGEQLPRSPAHQRLVWEEDRRDNIVRVVEDMMEVLRGETQYG